jgi:hypothetical protein
LGCVFFEDFRIIDEIVFVDQKKHPLFNNQFTFFVDKQGYHTFIFSNLNLYSVGIFAKFGARIGTNLFEQFWDLAYSLVISRDIADHTKNSRLENMTQKCVSQSSSFCSTLDETWDIYNIEMSLLYGNGT